MKITVTAEIDIADAEVDKSALLSDVEEFFCDNEQTYHLRDIKVYVNVDDE